MSESDSAIAGIPISRRQLLGAGGTATALAALGVGGTGALGSSAVAAATRRDYYTGTIHFLLNGVDQGTLSDVKGGALQLHPGNALTVENVVLTCNGNLKKSFFDWVDACLQGRPGTAQSAEIAFVDAAGAIQHALTLAGARATRLVIGKIDAQAKEPLDISVTIAAASADHRLKRGGTLPGSKVIPRYLLQAYALFIEGLEEVTRYTSSIGELSMTIAPQPGRGGSGQDARQCGPLTFEVPLNFAEPLYRWFQEWAKGHIAPRRGVLQFLDPTRKNVLASVDFSQLSPLRIGALSKVRDDGVSMAEVVLQPVSFSLNFTDIQ